MVEETIVVDKKKLEQILKIFDSLDDEVCEYCPYINKSIPLSCQNSCAENILEYLKGD